MMISGYLVKDSDNSIEFQGAQDAVSGDPINTATMQVSVFTRAGVLVAGPVSGTYVIGSSGDYVTILQDSIDWEADDVYKVVITMNGGPNHKRTLVRYLELIE